MSPIGPCFQAAVIEAIASLTVLSDLVYRERYGGTSLWYKESCHSAGFKSAKPVAERRL